MNNFLSEIETGFEEQNTKVYILAKSWGIFSSLFQYSLWVFFPAPEDKEKFREAESKLKLYENYFESSKINSNLPIKINQ